MLGLVRFLVRIVWLAVFILGVRRALEIVKGGTEELISRIDEGEGTGLDQILIRLHEALHHGHARRSGEPDAFGEL